MADYTTWKERSQRGCPQIQTASGSFTGKMFFPLSMGTWDIKDSLDFQPMKRKSLLERKTSLYCLIYGFISFILFIYRLQLQKYTETKLFQKLSAQRGPCVQVICKSALLEQSPGLRDTSPFREPLFLTLNSLTHKVAASCGGAGAWEGGVGHVAKGPPQPKCLARSAAEAPG